MKINSEKFKKLLYLKGYTQRSFAKAIGIPEVTIWKYAQGIYTPRAERAAKIAGILKCDIKDFTD